MSTEVTEQNKVIAEFMGLSFDANKRDGAPFYKESNKDGWISKSYCNPRYHEDWNTLMPVIEKISKWPLLNTDNTLCTDIGDTSYPITFNMPSVDGKVMFRFKGFSLHVSAELIDACHAAVYEAIQWHNEYQSSIKHL